MSDCDCHHTSRNITQASLKDVILLGSTLIAAYLEQASQFAHLVAGSFPNSPSFSLSSGCCNIPETSCPPYCACEIEWEAREGEHLTANIRVTNTAREGRAFQFVPSPFQGPGNPAAPLTVSPPGAELQSGQSVYVPVQFLPDQSFQPGQTYHAELLLIGAYEERVCIVFRPLCNQQSECDVRMGEPPVRRRAHNWYDHFQCAEPCFPSTRTNPPTRPPQ
jgi:hypothetical protein